MAENHELTREEKRKFLITNISKGLGILAVFLGALFVFRHYGGLDYLSWLEPIYSRPGLVYTIFGTSEVFFGLIMPEIFMAWALNQGGAQTYMLIVGLLMTISFSAGCVNYGIGRWTRSHAKIRLFILKRLTKTSRTFAKFGGFLIIVAAMTPLPYGAVCLFAGSVRYDFKKFLWYNLFRLVRFTIYGFTVWKGAEL